MTIQRLLEEKVIDNPDLSVLTASGYTLHLAKIRPQPKSNQWAANVYTVELEAVPEISSGDSEENCCTNSKSGMQSPAVQPSKNVELPTQNICARSIVLLLSDEVVMLRQQVE